MSPSKIRIILATLGMAAGFTLPAQATTISVDASITDDIPAVATFQTTGSLMGGMSVTAMFSSGLSETVSWVDGLGAFGSATGTGWSLSINGDTFATPWRFSNGTQERLNALILDGAPGFTLFDRTFNNLMGTPGSALGRDFAETPTVAGDAVYSHQVQVTPGPPVGDLWHMLAITFDDGLAGDFTFVQDTDNDSRRTPPPAPEPSTLALLGGGLFLLGASGRRRRRRRRG